MKQIRFIPSGCQFWYKHTISAAGDCFAYCSTMAIYFYKINELQVDKIIACHDTTLTSISWSPQNPNRLASTCLDGLLYIWDIEKEIPEAKIPLGNLPIQCEFSHSDNELLAILLENGDIKIYDLILKKLEKFNNFDGAKLLRWNPSTPGKLAIGCEDGRLIIHNFKKLKTTKIAIKQKPAVDDIQWDPNSQNYLLLSWKDGSISLIDADDEKEMQVFDRQGTGISCIAWIKSIPGGFVTCNDKISAIRVWNVSNKAPLSTVKIGTAGLLNIINLYNTSYGKEGLLCTFKNGSVGLFNFTKKKLEFLSQPNHSETIFDTQFKTNDKDTLATASFDGSIKIWNIKNMQCTFNLSKNAQQHISGGIKSAAALKSQVIYGISWHPMGENKLVSASSSGEVMLWDTDKGKLLSELQLSSGTPIYRIEWNPSIVTYIASGSSENIAYVYQTDGKKLSIYKKLKHPAAVFGVSWNPTNKDMLATACQDGLLRLFDVQTEQLIKALQGHTARIFNLAWNPITPNVLASGSDDKTIRIWDIKSGISSVLQGHSNNVRAIVWNTELPWLILSGSWDSTIRIWDIRDKKCIHVATDHHSDVYGVSTHSGRPFMYVSCSRDTSLRFWTMERLISPVIFRLLVTNDWNDVIGDIQNPNQFKLFGNKGKKLASEAKTLMKTPVEYYQQIMEFFYYLEYQNELWDIIKALILGKNEDTNNRLVTLKNLPSAFYSKAKELESSNQNTFSYDPLNKKSDKLNEAANIYLKLGEFESYCETLIKLNKWEKALAFAPAVSYDYWQNLAKRYAEYLNAEENDETAGAFLMAGQIEDAIKFYMGRTDFEDAKLISYLRSIGKFDHLMADERYTQNDPKIQDTPNALKQTDNILREIIENLSENFLKNGQPVLAAASHLSINDVESAILKLYRANEMLYAYVLCKLFNSKLINLVCVALAKRAERLNERHLGQALFKQAENQNLLSIYLANYPNVNKEALDNLYKQNALLSCDKNDVEGDKHLAKKNYSQAVYYILFSRNVEKAANIALQFAKDCLSKQQYENIGEAIEVFDILSNFNIANLPSKTKNEIISINLYFGLKKAIWKGYYPILPILFKTLKRILKTKKEIEFPVAYNTLKLEVFNFMVNIKPEETFKKLGKLSKVLTNENERSYATSLMKNLTAIVLKDSKAKSLEKEMNRNRFYITGNNLPVHSNPDKKLKSYLTQASIKAEGYLLDDNQSLVTLEEAIMLHYSNRYAPTASGNIMNPF